MGETSRMGEGGRMGEAGRMGETGRGEIRMSEADRMEKSRMLMGDAARTRGHEVRVGEFRDLGRDAGREREGTAQNVQREQGQFGREQYAREAPREGNVPREMGRDIFGRGVGTQTKDVREGTMARGREYQREGGNVRGPQYLAEEYGRDVGREQREQYLREQQYPREQYSREQQYPREGYLREREGEYGRDMADYERRTGLDTARESLRDPFRDYAEYRREYTGLPREYLPRQPREYPSEYSAREFRGRDYGREGGYPREYGYGRERDYGREGPWYARDREYGRYPREYGTAMAPEGREYGREYGRGTDKGYQGELLIGRDEWRLNESDRPDNSWLNFGYKGWELPSINKYFRPRTDIIDEGHNVRVEMEMPGVQTEDIRATVRDDLLTVLTTKAMSKKERNGAYLQNERHYGHYYRQVRLPEPVDNKIVSAVLDNGVLKITMPKSAEGTHERIAINTVRPVPPQTR
jgi:HSP20 family protein